MIESPLAFEILLILALIVVNGVFAMSEMAVVSSRKTRLQQLAENDDAGARRALQLIDDPTRFLSTVQIGITLVGVFAGAFGGASIAGKLDAWIEGRYPALGPYSEEAALVFVVAVITFLSLVIGELVPKRIALNHPERIASRVAGPMLLVSRIASPLVRLLSLSTETLLRLLRVSAPIEPPVTEEEVSAMLEAGTAAGVFEAEEQDLVERIFWLADQRVSSLMTPRHRIEWLDINDAVEVHSQELIRHRYTHYLVCDGSVDSVIGMVRMKDLLAEMLSGSPLDLHAALRRPLFVADNLRALRLLEMFRESGVHLAIVVDEHGGVDGLVTLSDVLVEITGALSVDEQHAVVQRDDGSWLVDGALTMDEFWERLGFEERRAEDRRDYNTVGGLVVTTLGRVPQVGTVVEASGMRFEVVDMDGRRVDKVLVTSLTDGQRAPV